MERYYNNKKAQLIFGLIIGILFGFFLQKGGVTKYDVILGQLRLIDFTVLKIMLTAVIVTMLGISYMYPKKKIKIHPKAGSIKNAIIGGLLFGVGFALLGYCPGTIAGAVGNGHLDALLAGIIGIIIGSGVFASIYTLLKTNNIIIEDKYSKVSVFDKMPKHPLRYTIPISLILIGIMILLEQYT